MQVLDLGAAPGSWAQYCLKVVGHRGSVVAVDRRPIERVGDAATDRRLTCLLLDIEAPELLRCLQQRAPFQTILSDAAPNTTGNHVVDSERSTALAETALTLALALLAPGGALVVKLFQGGQERRLFQRVAGLFERARYFKPQASRRESYETFLVAKGYRCEATDAP